MDRFPNPAEDEIPTEGPQDDLDEARVLLDQAHDSSEYEIGSAYALKAIAHVMLWNAERHRDVLRQVADAARLAKEWRESQPPPPPPMPAYPIPYPGF